MARAKTPRNGHSGKKEIATSSTVAIAPETKRSFSPADLEAEIRRRAYELYVERGYLPGHEDEDWLVAEREVRARYQHQQSA